MWITYVRVQHYNLPIIVWQPFSNSGPWPSGGPQSTMQWAVEAVVLPICIFIQMYNLNDQLRLNMTTPITTRRQRETCLATVSEVRSLRFSETKWIQTEKWCGRQARSKACGEEMCEALLQPWTAGCISNCTTWALVSTIHSWKDLAVHFCAVLGLERNILS